MDFSVLRPLKNSTLDDPLKYGVLVALETVESCLIQTSQQRCTVKKGGPDDRVIDLKFEPQ